MDCVQMCTNSIWREADVSASVRGYTCLQVLPYSNHKEDQDVYLVLGRGRRGYAIWEYNCINKVLYAGQYDILSLKEVYTTLGARMVDVGTPF